MDAPVGGRIQAVARRPAAGGGDYLRLLLLAAAAAAVHGWLLTHTFVTARDSLGFARMALNLGDPKAAGDPDRGVADVLRDKTLFPHPPGYPLAVLAASKLAAPVGPPPEAILHSAQLASAAAAVLLVVPAYFLGRALFGRWVGFGAALLFQLLPVAARVTSDGLTESLYLLFATSAVLFGVRAVRRAGVLDMLLCGLLSGLTYLVRPEGLMVVLAAGTVGVGLMLFRRWPLAAGTGRLAALAVGVLLPAAPYMAVIGGLTNKPTANDMFKGFQHPTKKAWENVGRGGGRELFAEWVSAGDWVAVGKVMGKETLKGFHYAPFALAVVGLAVYRRRIVADPGMGLVVVLGVINLAVLGALATARSDNVGYVSERHTLLVVLLGCPFAVAALRPTARWLAARSRVGRVATEKPLAVLLFAAIAASAVPGATKPLHANRAGHKAAGLFLKDKIGPDHAVIDPHCWAEWFAGRTLYAVPPDPAKPTVRWAVLERDKDDPDPHSRERAARKDEALAARQPRLQAALDVANDGKNPATIAYHWPEGKPASEARVIVYRQEVKE